MKKYLILAILVLFSTLAQASEWSGRIIEIKSITGAYTVLFKLSGEIESPTRCNEYGMYAIDLNAPGGQVQLELLKLAYAGEKLVKAESLNTCSVHWKSENVKEISILP